MARKKTDEPTTFEDDLEALEACVSALEGGELDLDAALAKFEEGVALTRKLRAKLDAAEGRVEQLLASGETRELDVE